MGNLTRNQTTVWFKESPPSWISSACCCSLTFFVGRHWRKEEKNITFCLLSAKNLDFCWILIFVGRNLSPDYCSASQSCQDPKKKHESAKDEEFHACETILKLSSFSSIHLFYPHSTHLLCKMSWMLPGRRPRHVFYRHCHKILSDLNNSVPFSNIPSCDPNLTLAKHTLALPCLARRGQDELPSTAENCGNSGKVAARGQTPCGAMRLIGRSHQISTVY